jgi:hypothetical protein
LNLLRCSTLPPYRPNGAITLKRLTRSDELADGRKRQKNVNASIAFLASGAARSEQKELLYIENPVEEKTIEIADKLTEIGFSNSRAEGSSPVLDSLSLS